ncbi:MAG TPA: PHB depolymerase family esterase [Candidatus Polarisedimenticolia bacterium]|nr:PHB depolymerase family esterase [Candidatus Polarisedimenticolia bacterium]
MTRSCVRIVLLVMAVGVHTPCAQGGPPTKAARGPAGGACGLSPGDVDRTIQVGGMEREYRVYAPSSFDSTRRSPLLIVLHGGGGSGPGIEELSRITPVADAHGFLVALPTGTKGMARGNSWNAGDCCGTAMEKGVDDLGFISKMIDTLVDSGCVDPQRVYATGISNGAILSYRLACELSDKIAAIAPIAGALMVDPCTPKRPVPAIIFHGTADREVKVEGNFNRMSHPRREFPPLKQTIRTWLRINHCTDATHVTYSKGAATCETYEGCAEGNDVTFCRIEGGGHTWPGGKPLMPFLLGPTTQDISADEEMWKFFAAHPMKTTGR